MNKSLKILITIVVTIMALWVIIFAIDYYMCANCKMPIFVIASETADDGGSGTYYGLGYEVKVEKNISADYGVLIEKVEMYMFDKIVIGAITNIDVFYDTPISLKVIPDETKGTEKITTGELDAKYDYDIYYSGLENVTIKFNNKEMDLVQALLSNEVTMEQIIEQAEKDAESEIIRSDMLKDGGTMFYYYDTYTIKKCYSLDGNRDVYILKRSD